MWTLVLACRHCAFTAQENITKTFRSHSSWPITRRSSRDAADTFRQKNQNRQTAIAGTVNLGGDENYPLPTPHRHTSMPSHRIYTPVSPVDLTRH